MAACEPAQTAEVVTRDCPDSVLVERQGVVYHSGCGGCDTRCWLTTDDPAISTDVVLSGDDQNGNLVGYEDTLDAIVLEGSVPGADTDADGLPDVFDPSPADANGDADGDGYPDAWEVYNGTDPLVADAAPPSDEIYAVLPAGGPAVTASIPPTLPIKVRSADVYFLIDTTSSMLGEITNLRSSLSTYVVPEVQARIADVQFGVGHYRDYVSVAGGRPYYHVQSITSDVAAVQTALNSLATGTGRIASSEWTESGTEALYAVVSGLGIGCGVNAAPLCAAGRWGYPCFRDEAQAIIVMITDHEFHRGVWDDYDPPVPDGLGEHAECYDYTGSCTGSTCLPIPVGIPDLQGVVTELVARNTKVLGLFSGLPNYSGRVDTWLWGYPPAMAVRDCVIDLYYAVEQSGTVDSTGVPFLYGVAADGSGIGVDVVNGIDDLVKTMLIDVSSTWSDPDATGPDSSVLVDDVDPVSCTNCASIDHGLNVAYDVYPGSSVPFDIVLRNDAADIPITPAPQELEVLVQILGDGSTVLGERLVHVLVPGSAGVVVPPTVGEYWHVFEHADICGAAETSRWEVLSVDLYEPAGTWIDFTVQTATDDTAAEWAAATVVPLALDAANEANIEEALTGALLPATQDFLRINATLNATTPGDTPELYSMTVTHYCL
jgi:hypothetical protein